jgi:hypothetical protein
VYKWCETVVLRTVRRCWASSPTSPRAILCAKNQNAIIIVVSSFPRFCPEPVWINHHQEMTIKQRKERGKEASGRFLSLSLSHLRVKLAEVSSHLHRGVRRLLRQEDVVRRLVHAHRHAAMARNHLYENQHASLLGSQLSLCLSRACLGKTFIFSIKWLKRRRFSHLCAGAVRDREDLRAVVLTVGHDHLVPYAKTKNFCSAFHIPK